MLKTLGEKSAYAQVDPRSGARFSYEPKPPAKIQRMINQKD